MQCIDIWHLLDKDNVFWNCHGMMSLKLKSEPYGEKHMMWSVVRTYPMSSYPKTNASPWQREVEKWILIFQLIMRPSILLLQNVSPLKKSTNLFTLIKSKKCVASKICHFPGYYIKWVTVLNHSMFDANNHGIKHWQQPTSKCELINTRAKHVFKHVRVLWLRLRLIWGMGSNI